MAPYTILLVIGLGYPWLVILWSYIVPRDTSAHVSDRTTAASTVTTPKTPTNLALITQPGNVVSHLDAPYSAADYIADLEEELADRTSAAAAESAAELAAAAITTPVDQTTLLVEELRFQHKQNEDLVARLTVMAGGRTPAPQPDTPAPARTGGRPADIMCTLCGELTWHKTENCFKCPKNAE